MKTRKRQIERMKRQSAKEMTLQNAWDLIADELHRQKTIYCAFVSTHGGGRGTFGHGVLYSVDPYIEIAVSTKKYL